MATKHRPAFEVYVLWGGVRQIVGGRDEVGDDVDPPPWLSRRSGPYNQHQRVRYPGDDLDRVGDGLAEHGRRAERNDDDDQREGHEVDQLVPKY